MDHDQDSGVFRYQLDQTDTIVHVSDNWNAFAGENDWQGALSADRVVGHSLWMFIQDPDTRQIYQELFKRVRKSGQPLKLPFRCDAPHERRYLELIIAPLPEAHIQITSRILRTTGRPPVALLDPSVPRSSELVTLCSVCKKMK